MKQATRFTISLLLTGVFLALFLRGVDLDAAWQSLGGASLPLIAASVVLNLSAYLVRAWRWRHLLAPVRERLGMYNLTATTFIGFMVTFLVPFRVGEIVRPVLLARRERLSPSSALATIALERLFDAATVMTLFLCFAISSYGVSLLAAPALETGSTQATIYLQRGVLATTLFAALGLGAVLLIAAFPDRVVGAIRRISPERISARRAWIVGVVERFIQGLNAVRRRRELLASAALSLFMWLVIDLSVYLCLKAFGLPLGFFDTFLLMVPLTVGIAMPTPGGVGPYEFLCQIFLVDFWGVQSAAAAAVAVTLHASTMIPPILVGLMIMWRDGLRPAEVRGMATVEAMAGREEAP